MDIFATQAQQKELNEKIFGLSQNIGKIQKQKQQIYNNQKVFQQVKKQQDILTSLNTGIVQALQVKSKLTSLDKKFMQQLFPINQQSTAGLVTAQKLTLGTIQKLSAYQIFSVAFVTLLTGLLQIQTNVDSNGKLLKDNNGKSYIEIVNEFFQLKLFQIQKLVQKLINIVKNRKNGQKFIRQMIIQKFCAHMKTVMQYFNYNLSKSVFLGLLFNPKSSKVIQKNDVVPVQSAIVAMQMKRLYAQNIYPQGTYHLMNFMKSVAHRKRQQFMRQVKIKHQTHFAMIKQIPLISQATSDILGKSQYLYEPNQTGNVLKYALNNFHVDYENLPAGFSNYKWISTIMKQNS